MEDRLMSRTQVAAYLSISPRTVDAWEQRGVIPKALRIGDRQNSLVGTRGLKRWRASDIVQFQAKD
jgi:predicted DNA-binding transcriptional regulator AlpA